MTAPRARRVVPLAFLFMAACGGDGDAGPTAPATVVSVRITPGAPTVEAGATVALSATPLDANGSTLAGRSVSWQSDSPTVATVSAAGVVTGLMPGSAGIRAVIDGVAGTVDVTVTPPSVASVIIQQTQPNLEVGATLQLVAEARDGMGNALPDRTIQWSVADAAIATVSSGGLLTGLAAGNTAVRATSESVTGEVALVVTPAAAAAVTLSRDTATLVPNQPLALTATVLDARQDTLAGRTVIWTSSAPAVATVASDGTVTAVGVGQTTISAAVETQSAEAMLTVVPGGWVTPAGGGVSADPVSMVVPAGAVDAPLAITVDPVVAPPADPRLIAGTAYNFGPDGTTFNAPVAVSIRYAPAALNGVDPARLQLHRYDGAAWVPVEGSSVDVGSAIVTAPTASFSSYAVLDGSAPVATIVLEPAAATVAPGEGLQLKAVLRDADQNLLGNRAVDWTSADPGIATVSATGLVTGVEDGGPVTITATSEGQSTTAEITVLTPFTYSDLAVGFEHTCGLTPTGAAYCWGRNTRGQLGIGTTTPGVVPRPVAVGGGLTFTRIAPGEAFTCALEASGAAYCWGENARDGQLGIGSLGNRPSPTAVAGGQLFVDIATGARHACALTQDGAAYCWGQNLDGGVGDGTFVDRWVPTAVSTTETFTDITLGEDFTCALTAEGAVWCWGTNVYGQLGSGTTSVDDIPTPVQVAGGHVFTQVSAGADHTCAVKANGEAWCWGRETSGQLGVGTNGSNHRRSPVQVDGPFQYASVMGGERHTCGLLTDGRVACWGLNLYGGVGDGTRDERLVPTLVAGDQTFAQLADGYTLHSCARTAEGVAYCWGENSLGQIGNGEADDPVLVPTRVVNPAMPAAAGRSPR